VKSLQKKKSANPNTSMHTRKAGARGEEASSKQVLASTFVIVATHCIWCMGIDKPEYRFSSSTTLYRRALRVTNKKTGRAGEMENDQGRYTYHGLPHQTSAADKTDD